MMTVYVDMVGDLFHYGHTEMLRRARALGDELLVGVCGDDTVEVYKRRPVLTLDERVRIISACRYVDRIWADCPLRLTDADIDSRGIDLVVHGDDWTPEAIALDYAVPMRRGMLRILPSTPTISTSDIIARVIRRADELAPSVAGRLM
jgi:cytidyltransferase-like protein